VKAQIRPGPIFGVEIGLHYSWFIEAGARLILYSYKESDR
jgi:hypothetical protein